MNDRRYWKCENCGVYNRDPEDEYCWSCDVSKKADEDSW